MTTKTGVKTSKTSPKTTECRREIPLKPGNYIGRPITPEWGFDDHVAYTVKITKALIEKCKKIAKIVADNEWLHVELFDYSINVFSYVPSGKFIERSDEYDDGELFDECEYEDNTGEQEQIRLDCCTLVISDDYFYWTYYPKHGGVGSECRTDTFYFSTKEE